jgi:hypothetical protein
MTWDLYTQTSKVLMRPYVVGESLAGIKHFVEPQDGDFIVRSALSPEEQWVLTKEYVASRGFKWEKSATLEMDEAEALQIMQCEAVLIANYVNADGDPVSYPVKWGTLEECHGSFILYHRDALTFLSLTVLQVSNLFPDPCQ